MFLLWRNSQSHVGAAVNRPPKVQDYIPRVRRHGEIAVASRTVFPAHNTPKTSQLIEAQPGTRTASDDLDPSA